MKENNTLERRDDKVDIVALWRKACKKWYLFVGSVAICVALVLCYIKITNPVYLVSADVLVNEEEKGGSGVMAAMSSGFSLDGLFGGGAVNDEVLILSSHTLIRDVVKQLELNKTYTAKTGFLEKKIYYKDSPLKVVIPEAMMDTITEGFALKVQINSAGDNIKVELRQGYFTTLLKQEASAFPVKVDYGQGLVIDTTSFYQKGEALDFTASISSYDAMTEYLEEKLSIGLTDKKANGISLSIEDANIERGKDFLNRLIACYDKDAEINKNIKANNMLNFINERLFTVKKDLDEAEYALEQYKRENDLSDIDTEAKIILEANHQYRKNLLEAETQYSIISMVDSFLNKPENKYSLVPVTTGLPDKGAAEAINEYNKLLLERMRLLRTATDSNISLQSLTAQIDAMRDNILNTVSKAKESSNIAREDLKKQENEFKARLRGFPEQERAYFDLKRDQLIKSELYTFLTQRREESAMALSSTLPKCRIINPAYSTTKPIAPNVIMLLALALVVGLVLPVIYLYGKSFFSNKFNTRDELKDFSRLPIIGEITHNSTKENVVFTSDSTNSTAESIRLLRSNLQFALPEQEIKVLTVTSFEEEAGKSFVATNLAVAMAMMERRTVLVDLNLRTPAVAECMGISSSYGVADYLAQKFDDETKLIQSTVFSSNLDVILAGNNTKNPSDMLYSDRLKQLIFSLKEKYECVIIDSASVEHLADTFSLTQLTDATLFICRANHTHRKALSNVDDMVAEGSLKNVQLVLNDIEEYQVKRHHR